MKLAYLSSSYVPSRRASGVQVMKMCSAFSRLGHEVTLITKRNVDRQEPGVEDEFAFYGIHADFLLSRVSRPGWPGGGLVYALGILRFLRSRRSSLDLAYCRDLYGAWLATRLGLPTVFEAHEPMSGPAQRRLLKSVLRAPSFRRLVAISSALSQEYRLGFAELERADLLVAPDGADPADPKSGGQDSADSSRGLRVGYVGQLYRGKGLEVLIPLSRRHPEFEFEVVGGTRDALERLATDKLPSNLSLHGFVPPGVLSEWFERFDVVLMPYQRRVEVAGGRSDASRWMSPLKMFEYMAAGKAIVSSDLPVLREVLEDEENAILVPPEDLDSWSEALQRLDRDPDLRKRLGAAAREALLAHYSWDQRASAVLAGLGTPGR